MVHLKRQVAQIRTRNSLEDKSTKLLAEVVEATLTASQPPSVAEVK